MGGGGHGVACNDRVEKKEKIGAMKQTEQTEQCGVWPLATRDAAYQRVMDVERAATEHAQGATPTRYSITSRATGYVVWHMYTVAKRT